MRKLLYVVLLGLCALPALAQKGAVDELGFNAEKLYDFSHVDSVNLFNGNLILSVPLGPRYSVSSHLSYQFTLAYNTKIWDSESYPCDEAPPACTVFSPNLASNVAVGWRLSLGRLLPSGYGGVFRPKNLPDSWIYEGPAGDEHPLGPDGTTPAQVNVHDQIRMVIVSATVRNIELASGEIHRFEKENGVWRLKTITDRDDDNWVHINYTYDVNDDQLETGWTVTDSVGRSHSVALEHYSAMSGGWSRGQMVKSVTLEGFGGTDAAYTFTRSLTNDAIPLLRGISQPDGTSYSFDYCSLGTCNVHAAAVSKVTYPTGGTVSYKYGTYQFIAQDSPCVVVETPGVTQRTIHDGVTAMTWDYVQSLGTAVPTTSSIVDPCNTGQSPAPALPGPVYWSRTSILAPSTQTSVSPPVFQRSRTDHYFSTFSDNSSIPLTITNPLPAIGLQAYGYPGAIGTPPLGTRRGAALVPPQFGGSDVDGSTDDSATPSRLLASEMFDQCDSAGNCTSGLLLRSLYERYAGTIAAPAHLISSRTLYPADGSCTPHCYTQTTFRDSNELYQFRTRIRETNFPTRQSIETTTDFPSWSTNDLVSATRKPWLLNVFTEKTRTGSEGTSREKFCFDSTTGVLLRHRMLKNAAPGATDVLQVFSYDGHNDLQFTSEYGGDVQALGTETDLCGSITLPARPWYKTETSYTYVEPPSTSRYTGGIPVWTKYLDRTSGAALPFFSLQRDVDRFTGVVTKSTDNAGVSVSYGYDALPARLHTVTTPAGAVTTYTYTAASGVAGSAFTGAKVDASTVSTDGSVASRFVFDGLGRVVQKSLQGPQAWSATQMTYDADGRVLTASEPVSTGTGPASGTLVTPNVTTYVYDALGRMVKATLPDGSVNTHTYTGDRQRTRTSTIWTGTTDSPVTVTEEYDGFGRLVAVKEPAGPTTAAAVIGSEVTAAYEYDSADRLRLVTMNASTGPLQSRSFDYDGRGFMRWENHPETGFSSYEYDPRGHVVSKTQSAANSLFDLKFTYDSAERMTKVEGRDPSSPTSFREIKKFEFIDANDGSDRRSGKLYRATRHNYGESSSEPEYEVADVYKYADVAGRLSDKTTTITQVTNGFRETVKSFTVSTSYDALDLLKTLKYPGCDGCGLPATDPDHALMTRTYSARRLTALSGFVDNISYWPNGLRNVLEHSNGIDDAQVVTNMPRPSQISFGRYDRCVQPTFTTQPVGGQVTSGGSILLSVVADGTPPFKYEWVNRTNSSTPPGADPDSSTLSVSPSATTEYSVRVSNPCGYEDSQTAKITVNQCATPSTGVIKAVAQPDGSWVLVPNPVARQGRTFQWTRLPNTPLSTAETQAVAALSSTTTFRLTITDSCGTSSGDVTIVVPLPITNGLQATALSSPIRVSLTWPSIPGAALYTVQRRSGATWATIGTSNSPGYTDNDVVAQRAYAYHVVSDNGGSTDVDVATTTSFTSAVQGQTVTKISFDQMLAAVNSIRVAAGWPSLTWSNVLSPSDPLPDPGIAILARHVMACRARMNEALQALGVRAGEYTDPELVGSLIKASNVNDVLARAQ